jgi:hypothetical protein
MTDTLTQDFTVLSNNTAATPASGLSFDGPKEVLLNQATVLKGSFDPNRIRTVSLVAEDKYPLTVTTIPTSATWQVKLDKGFQSPGTRWLRLKGVDSAGKTVSNQIVYLTVSTDPLTVGQGLSLRVVSDTLFKASPIDSARLNPQQKVTVNAGQSYRVHRYGFIDGHIKVELENAIAPVGNFGYFYEPHVQLSKGTQVLRFDIDDVPTTKLSAQMLATSTTLLKSRLADSANLAANQQTELLQGQTFQIAGYACIQGHFRVTLAQPIADFGDTGFVYWRHVALKQGNREIPFDQDALTVTATKATILKKRPLDSANLKPQETYNFPAGTFYGVSSYALEDGHIKVALTEELPNFGNTGYVFPTFVQMRRGGRAFNPYPSQVEISVPYFSQRDNPRFSWSTCNVTAIAMVFYYYGIRGKGRQLEDELLQWILSRYPEGAQTDHNVLSALIRAYGFKSSFSTTRRWSEVKEELIARRPVVLGGDFTASGHIVCLIGFTPQGYIVNDPWGNALSGYTNTEGRKLFYPNSYMDRVAGPDGNVWAHFIARG